MMLDCVISKHTMLAKAGEESGSKSTTHTKYSCRVIETCKLCSAVRRV